MTTATNNETPGADDHPMPVELLRDHRGIYGIGVTDDFDLEALAWASGVEKDHFIPTTPRPLILRPDLLSEQPKLHYGQQRRAAEDYRRAQERAFHALS